jgi:putative transposase
MKTPPKPFSDFAEGELHRGHRSIRLKGYDYNSPGLYFVTICCDRKRCVLGKILNANVNLSKIGQAVRDCWIAIPLHFPNSRLHQFVVMPNHVHGIIEILRASSRLCEDLPPIDRPPPIQPGSLPAIVRSFKAAAAKRVRENLKLYNILWQRNYYERVLRDGEEFSNAIRYIAENPAKWEWDRENPERRRV